MRQLESFVCESCKCKTGLYKLAAGTPTRDRLEFHPNTMSSGAPLEIADLATAHVLDVSNDFKNETYEKRESVSSAKEDLVGPSGEQYPTEEEWKTLRRVYGKVNWMIYVIGVVEMCERFAYYGTTAVCKSQGAVNSSY